MKLYKSINMKPFRLFKSRCDHDWERRYYECYKWIKKEDEYNYSMPVIRHTLWVAVCTKCGKKEILKELQ